MVEVLNAKTAAPEQLLEAVYIGRPDRWGNPFVIGRDGDRGEVIEKYRRWLWQRLKKDKSLRVQLVKELKGRDLVCWCAPERCHGHVLLRAAEWASTSF